LTEETRVIYVYLIIVSIIFKTAASSSTTNYELSDGVIQKAHGIHQNTAVINIKSSVNSAVTAE